VFGVRRGPGIVAAAVALGVTLGVAPLTAGAAATHTTILKYYSVTLTVGVTTPAGKAVPQNAPPSPGNVFFTTDNDYVGNAAHHAAHWRASDALRCTVDSVSKTAVWATCIGEVAIGGSLLISVSRQNVASTASTTVYPITAGTGQFVGAHGTITSISLGSSPNGELVVDIQTP
jgi:hypothetical protein